VALDITSDRVRSAATVLADGGWRFTGRQLYYAVCREVEVPRTRVAPGLLSFGVLLILIGAVTGQRTVLAILAALGLLLLAAGIVTHVSERRPGPDSRLLAASFDSFRADHLDGRSYQGQVVEDGDAVAAVEPGPVVVCDRHETALMLRANAARLGDAVRVVGSEAMGALPPGAAVVVVHDAAPGGCAVVAEARERGLAVVDAGLNPGDVMGRRMQVIEGAPARLPRDLGGCLSTAEVDWLLGGRRLELATLTPEETVIRVRAALAGEPAAAAAAPYTSNEV
jgi:hypothetical protein